MGSLWRDLMAGPPPASPRTGGLGALLSGFIDPVMAGGGPTTRVSIEQGLRITTAYACIRLMSGLGGSLPPKVIQRDDKRRRELRQPEFAHIWGRPNPVMTRSVYWESTIAGAATYGNAFTWKSREDGSAYDETRPWRGTTELWPVHPKRVRVGQASDARKVYTLDDDRDHPLGAPDLAHVPLMSLDGVVGLSPIQQNAAALGLAVAAERFGNQFFSRGQQVSGILTSTMELEQKEADELAERWMQRHSGSSTSLRPAVLGKGTTWTPIAIPPDQAQFLETRGYQREEIVQIYGVPPHMIGLVSKSTSWGTGIEQQFIGFVVTVMIPLLVRFEQMVSDELLPPELEMKFSVQALLRGDMNARANFYRTLRMIGAMSADTILELEDLPPRGIADDYLSPKNMDRLVAGAAAAPGREGDDVAVARGFAPIAEARCPEPGCGALLGKDVVQASLWCKRCRAERTFGPYLAEAALAAAGDEELPRDGQDLKEALALAIAERMIA
ncbi:MAG: phage portal protein [Dehalococcoidia bacterium]